MEATAIRQTDVLSRDELCMLILQPVDAHIQSPR
jgi:hypothetical protein